MTTEAPPAIDVRDRLYLMSAAYGRLLKPFVEAHSLETLVCFPLDHIAIKLEGEETYKAYLRDIKKYTVSVSENPDIDGRPMAIATLSSDIVVGDRWTRRLQIMHPKPGKTGNSSHLDHSEIFMPQFDIVARVLEAKQIPYMRKHNSGHRTLVIQLNELGQELKFTDRPISDVEREQILEGSSYWIQPPEV